MQTLQILKLELTLAMIYPNILHPGRNTLAALSLTEDNPIMGLEDLSPPWAAFVITGERIGCCLIFTKILENKDFYVHWLFNVLKSNRAGLSWWSSG